MIARGIVYHNQHTKWNAYAGPSLLGVFRQQEENHLILLQIKEESFRNKWDQNDDIELF